VIWVLGCSDTLTDGQQCRMAVNDTFADIAALLKDLPEAEIAELASGRRHPSPTSPFLLAEPVRASTA
jgi:hypothetical protein